MTQALKANEPVVILEELDFLFKRSELAEIHSLWNEGFSITDIAKRLKRDKNELFLAVFHLSMSNNSKKDNNIKIKMSQVIGGLS
ncbi:helix-turn-helix domain-containing protein [Salipaludibacillus agaradhaerens]|uniref:helix-turn-helix domain-containing protein n=1 Tax=Salipaludibacillus agaradhaerens TaxID=76935 RepID=UPI000998266C|nr:helix-turn-helix domain-containing protein [Salipaludibacillus agaradhaerens]